MSPTPIDQVQSPRPVAAQAAAMTTGRVVPVVPVNPPSDPAPSPGVVNLVQSPDKPAAVDEVYRMTDAPAKDWTIKRPPPEKVEEPPPEPISKILIDHIKSLWEASASAVQVQQQVRNQIEPLPTTSATVVPGSISGEVYNFSPTKINKVEKPEN